MARRRKLTGTPLLMATSGVVLAVGCGGGGPPPIRTGNLMPPPEMEGQICVDTTPPNATVQVMGNKTTERCTPLRTFEGAMVTVEVSALGYATELVEKPFSGGTLDLAIELVAEPTPPPPERERPVGNLMAPPEIEIDTRPAPEKPE